MGVLLWGSATAPAWSQDGPPPTRAQIKKAKNLFTLGNQSFKDGRYSDALASYRSSFELVERPRTLFNIAVCRDRLGDLEGGFVDYQRFLATAQERDADLVERARTRVAELQASLTLKVVITSSPAGAAIHLGPDAESPVAGRTPATLELKLGQHSLYLVAAGHSPVAAKVEVTAGTPARLDVTLPPLGRIALTAAPADASIQVLEVDGAVATGSLSRELEPGTYTVEVTRANYHSQRVTLQLLGRDALNRHIVLQPVQEAAPLGPEQPTGGPGPAVDGSPGRGLRYTGLGLGVLGVLAVSTGARFAERARSLSTEAQARADDGEWDPVTYDDAVRTERQMYIALGLGGAALLTGGLLYALGRSAAKPRRDAVTVQPSLTGRAAGFTVLGSF